MVGALAPVLVGLALQAPSTVTFSELPSGGGFVLTNGVVRSRWVPAAGSVDGTRNVIASGLTQRLDIFGVGAGGWTELADSVGVEVAIRSFPYNRSITLREKLAIPGLDGALPPPAKIVASPTLSTSFLVEGEHNLLHDRPPTPLSLGLPCPRNPALTRAALWARRCAG